MATSRLFFLFLINQNNYNKILSLVLKLLGSQKFSHLKYIKSGLKLLKVLRFRDTKETAWEVDRCFEDKQILVFVSGLTLCVQSSTKAADSS